MTISTKKPLYAEVHNVPDDYEFTDEELNRIIAGDMFTPRQDAIMAREIQKLRAAMLQGSQPVSQAYKLNALDGNSPVTPDGWIPVSERMPEPYEYVLVTDGFDGCEVMRVNTDGYWGPAKSLYPGGITHWMPLPEPPQEAK